MRWSHAFQEKEAALESYLAVEKENEVAKEAGKFKTMRAFAYCLLDLLVLGLGLGRYRGLSAP